MYIYIYTHICVWFVSFVCLCELCVLVVRFVVFVWRADEAVGQGREIVAPEGFLFV